MKEYIKNGRVYYYYGPKANDTISRYRFNWEKINGKIPKGYEIHHKDFNKINDDISNLQLMTKSEHMKLHADSMPEKQRVNANKNLKPRYGCDNPMYGKHSIIAKKVKCIETNEIFDSIMAAKNKYSPNIKGNGHIAEVCNGSRKTALGYTWIFIN